MKLEENDQYQRLISAAEYVKSKFSDMGIESTDQRTTFNPHLTIAKLSKLHEKRVKNKVLLILTFLLLSCPV